MSWWNSQNKELLYNRLHKTSIIFLVGVSAVLGCLVSLQGYNSIKKHRERKRLFAQGELPSKSE